MSEKYKDSSLSSSLEEGMKYVTIKNALGQVVTIKDGITYLDGVPQEPEEESDDEEIVGIASGEDWHGEDFRLENVPDEEDDEEEEELTGNYNPNQPRDSQGRFASGTSGGGTVNATEEQTKLIAEMGLSLEDVSALVGAQDGAVSTIQGVNLHKEKNSMFGPEDDYISVITKHPDYETRRTIYRNRIVNDSIEVKTKGQGLGTKILASQVEAASARGFTQIEGNLSAGPETNGADTFARLGFDAKIPGFRNGKYINQEAQSIVPGATKLSHLMATPEGRSWWKANSVPVEAVFDLTKGSYSQQALSAYLQGKK